MKKLVGFLSAIAALALFSCNSNVPPTGGDNKSLEKTHWVLSSIPGFSGELPAAPRDVNMMLDTGRVAGFAGCNRYFGSYTSSGTTLKFNGVASTKMFCEATMKVEDAVMAAINGTEGFHIHGSRLSLLKGSDTLAHFVAGKHAQ